MDSTTFAAPPNDRPAETDGRIYTDGSAAPNPGYGG